MKSLYSPYRDKKGLVPTMHNTMQHDILVNPHAPSYYAHVGTILANGGYNVAYINPSGPIKYTWTTEYNVMQFRHTGINARSSPDTVRAMYRNQPFDEVYEYLQKGIDDFTLLGILVDE